MQKTTIVFPCYNEEKRLHKAIFVEFLKKNNNIFIIFVDDGSTDNSLSLLQEMQKETPEQIHIHVLTKNSGKAEAVRQGLLKAIELGAYIVGYADADLATPLYELQRLAKIINKQKYKILLGSRVGLLGKQIQRKAIRHYCGRIFATVVASMILKLRVYDTQCGAKFFKCNESLIKTLSNKFSSKWIFDVELIKRLLNTQEISVNDFVEEPLNEWKDIDGSKLGVLSMLKVLLDLVKLKWQCFLQ
jgi:dolichyl-phosphate beta-glucosyltransferase